MEVANLGWETKVHKLLLPLLRGMCFYIKIRPRNQAKTLAKCLHFTIITNLYHNTRKKNNFPPFNKMKNKDWEREGVPPQRVSEIARRATNRKNKNNNLGIFRGDFGGGRDSEEHTTREE